MHPEALRILKRRRILRWLVFGVPLVLFLILILPPAINGMAERSPWIWQGGELKGNYGFMLAYREQHAGHWPTTFADLSGMVSDPNAHNKPRPFIDPDTGQSAPWLLFDPALVTPLPKHGRILAAAPRAGGPRKDKDQNRRIVMFQDSVVMFIPECDFIAATQGR